MSLTTIVKSFITPDSDDCVPFSFLACISMNENACISMNENISSLVELVAALKI